MVHFTVGGWWAIPVLAGVFWLPAALMAWCLRQYAQLGLAFALAGVLGVLGLLLLFMVVPDPSLAWLEVLKKVMPAELWAPQLQLEQAEFEQFLVELSVFLPGSTIASLVFSAMISVILARGWQARLFNPGGFQTEFHRLALGRVMGVAAVILVTAGLMFRSPVWVGLMTIALVVFLFQGLAIAHSIVKQRAMNAGWLVTLYFFGMLIPQVSLMVGGIGVLDTWIDFRKRLAASATDKFPDA